MILEFICKIQVNIFFIALNLIFFFIFNKYYLKYIRKFIIFCLTKN